MFTTNLVICYCLERDQNIAICMKKFWVLQSINCSNSVVCALPYQTQLSFWKQHNPPSELVPLSVHGSRYAYEVMTHDGWNNEILSFGEVSTRNGSFSPYLLFKIAQKNIQRTDFWKNIRPKPIEILVEESMRIGFLIHGRARTRGGGSWPQGSSPAVAFCFWTLSAEHLRE